jgi:hypothetical protein
VEQAGQALAEAGRLARGVDLLVDVVLAGA